MEILNHLVDLSDYGIEYTEADKRVFLEFENLIKKAGYNIQYMNTPADITSYGPMEATTMTFVYDINSGDDLFNKLFNGFDSKSKFVFDNTLFIYKIGKVKLIKEDITTFNYTMRLGSLLI